MCKIFKYVQNIRNVWKIFPTCNWAPEKYSKYEQNIPNVWKIFQICNCVPEKYAALLRVFLWESLSCGKVWQIMCKYSNDISHKVWRSKKYFLASKTFPMKICSALHCSTDQALFSIWAGCFFVTSFLVDVFYSFAFNFMYF